MKTASTTVRLPIELRDWLAKQARTDTRTLSAYVLRVLEAHRKSTEKRKPK